MERYNSKINEGAHSSAAVPYGCNTNCRVWCSQCQNSCKGSCKGDCSGTCSRYCSFNVNKM